VVVSGGGRYRWTDKAAGNNVHGLPERSGIMGLFMIMLIGGAIIMYFIADKFGNKDNTVSDNDSQKPLLGILSEECATGELKNDKDKVVRRSNLLLSIVLFIFFSIFGGLLIYLRDFGDGEISAFASVIIGVVAIAAGIFYLTMPFIFKMILDNDGITRNFNIHLGKFTVFDKSYLMRWSAVSRVCYEDIFNKIPGFRFYYLKPGEEAENPWFNIQYVVINFSSSNYKEAMEYAVKRLPKDKFMDDAKDKLKSMGIWK